MNETLNIIKKYNLSTKKKFGQNFLGDGLLLDKIVGVAGDISGKNVLEVGPGPGGLTRSILKKNPKKLVSVEIDVDLFKILKEEFSRYGNFFVDNEDALKVDEGKYFDGGINVIANLPYNVGTVLLMKWLDNLSMFDSFVLLLQKEVVERIVAVPSTKDYGRLSVMVQALCCAKKEFDVKPSFFIPPPKVVSSVVRIVPKKDFESVNVEKLSKITFALFNQRRKKIKGAVESLVENGILSEDCLQELDLNKRAEELSVDEFVRLSNLG